MNTDRPEFCPVVSPGPRDLYFISEYSFPDEPFEAPLSTRERNARPDGPGHEYGGSWRVPTSAVFGVLGRTPR